jgi:hypothetical protein
MSESDSKSEAPDGADSGGVAKRLANIRPADIVRLVFISILVGLILAAFRIDPRDLWVDFFGTIRDVWSRFITTLGDSIAWAVEYFLLGAIIVVPIWLAWHLIRAIGRR